MLWHKCFFFLLPESMMHWATWGGCSSPRGLGLIPGKLQLVSNLSGGGKVSWDSYNEGLLTDQLKKPTQISINWKIIETHSSPRGQTNVKWNGIRTKQSINKNNKPHFLFIKLEGWLPKISKTKNGEEQKQAFYVQRWKANLKELEKETKKKKQQTIAPLPLNRCLKYCNPLKCICFLRVIKANKFISFVKQVLFWTRWPYSLFDL